MRDSKKNNQLQEYILKLANKYKNSSKSDKLKVGQVVNCFND